MYKLDKFGSVIITGGNKGIGEAISEAFWKNGYFVIIGARTSSHLVKKLDERIAFKKTDVRSESSMNALVKYALKVSGRLDVFINCAGFSRWAPLEKVDAKFWDSMIDTNLKGTFLGCKAASKYLPDSGVIINVSSIAGKRGSANNSVYCASKFGVNGITQSLAKELGPKGIRVNAVCPVYVKTHGVLEALRRPFSPAAGQKINQYLENFASDNSALKRLPKADEIAAMCVFLASAHASAITGQCINVDCGVLPQ